MYKSEAELKADAVSLIVEQLRAAEMRQGCTNYTYHAEILLSQLEEIIFKYASLPKQMSSTLTSPYNAHLLQKPMPNNGGI